MKKDKKIEELEFFEESFEEEEEAFDEILHLLHAIPPVPVPPAFDVNLKKALQEEKKRKKVFAWKRFSALAAIFVVGFLSILFLEDGNKILPDGISLDQQELASSQNTVDEEETELFGAVSQLKREKELQDVALPEVSNAPVEPAASNKNIEVNREKTSAADGIEKEEMQLDNSNEPEDMRLFTSNIAQPTYEKPSRSFSYSGTAEEFKRCGNAKIAHLVEKINKNQNLALKTGSSLDEGAQELLSSNTATIKLYQDFFGNKAVTYTKILKSSVLGERQVYELQGNGKKLLVTLMNSSEGVVLSDPISDHADWLNEQLSDVTYVFQDYEINEDGSILFRVTVLLNEEGQSVNETRSMVWKPSE